MARNKHRSIGDGYKKVICAQTGAEVTRRQSLAVDYLGDGRGGSPAAPCKRVCRNLIKKEETLPEPVLTELEAVVKETIEKLEKVPAPKSLSNREKSKMKALLRSKK